MTTRKATTMQHTVTLLRTVREMSERNAAGHRFPMGRVTGGYKLPGTR